MVEAVEFKQTIRKRLAQDYQVEFLGKQFDQIVQLLTPTKAAKIYEWVSAVVSDNIQPILVGSNKTYKKWPINELLTFRYPFTINKTAYRILFVKVKNAVYIEFHLGNHKYYDKVRKDLALRNN